MSQSQSNSILEAIIDGRINDVRNLLLSGCNLKVDSYGLKPLHLAIVTSKYEITELLIEHGLDVNEPIETGYEKGKTPLHKAVENGKTPYVKLLIDHGANPNQPAPCGNYPLHLAAEKNYDDICKILINAGASISCASQKKKQTPLHSAVLYSAEDSALLLLELGADPNVVNASGESSFIIASKKCELRVLTALLQHPTKILTDDIKCALQNAINDESKESAGVVNIFMNVAHFEQYLNLSDIDIFTTSVKKGYTKIVSAFLHSGVHFGLTLTNGLQPLHLACSNNQPEVASLLIGQGANINVRDLEDKTPLQHAIAGVSSSCIDILMKHKVEVDDTIDLIAAINMGRIDLLDRYIENGYNLNIFSRGNTLLHAVAAGGVYSPDVGSQFSNGRLKIIERLVGLGFDINGKDSKGFSPLHHSCLYSHSFMVTKKLIELNGLVSSEDNDRNTPLHVAAKSGLASTCRLLIEKNAKLDARNILGQTPLRLAAEAKRLEAIGVLLDNGANINTSDNEGNSLVHIAAAKDLFRVLTVLLNRGAIIDARNSCGKTPLHLAAASGRGRICTLLMSWGADVNMECNDGQTPLMIAEETMIDVEQGPDFVCSDEEDWVDEWDWERYFALFEHQVIRLQELGLYVNGKNADSVSNTSPGNKSFRHDCQKEVVMLKNELLPHTSLTYYQLLSMEDEKILSEFVRKDVTCDIAPEFPRLVWCYRQMMDRKIRVVEKANGIIRRKKFTAFLLKTFDAVPDHCLMEIMQYISDNDLKKSVP